MLTVFISYNGVTYDKFSRTKDELEVLFGHYETFARINSHEKTISLKSNSLISDQKEHKD